MRLYIQPPARLVFRQFRPGLCFARGGMVLTEDVDPKLPRISFCRFEFFLETDDSFVTGASFSLGQLHNLGEDRTGMFSPYAWSQEPGLMDGFVYSKAKEEALEDGDHDHALYYFEERVSVIHRDITSEADLKARFSEALGEEWVIRHFFETTWVVPISGRTVHFDFRGGYRH